MYNTKVFTIDWKKYVLMYLPTALRKTLLFRMLLVITKPLTTIYTRFFDQRTDTLFNIRYDSSKGNIERMLNIKYYGAYDASDKKIYIENREEDATFVNTYIYTTDGRTNTDAAVVDSETTTGSYIKAETIGAAFYVYIPTAMAENEASIKEDVQDHILPSMGFEIIKY